jgi:hypothetical protein
MAFFKSITTISRNIAVLCVMALPMWALGAPGVENQYAKGWKMGLNVLLIYPVAWVINYTPYFVMKNRISAESRLRWQFITGSLALIILLIATMGMLQAFKTMR